MVITGSKKLNDFCRKYPDAEKTLAKWVEIVSNANWKNHNELKLTYSSADYVGNNRYVFNIRGNHYRLVVVVVVVVVFFAGAVNVRFVGTHSNYDRIDVKTI